MCRMLHAGNTVPFLQLHLDKSVHLQITKPLKTPKSRKPRKKRGESLNLQKKKKKSELAVLGMIFRISSLFILGALHQLNNFKYRTRDGLSWLLQGHCRDVATAEVQAGVTPLQELWVCRCWCGTAQLELAMAQGKSDSPGGHKLKFLCLGNNTRVI